MNKTERIGVILLFGLLVAWSLHSRNRVPPTEPPPTDVPAAPAGTVEPDIPTPPEVPVVGAEEALPAVSALDRLSAEQTVTLSNAVMRLTVTSWGGGVSSVALLDYRATIDEHSGPVLLDFSNQGALVYTGLDGLSLDDDFHVEALGHTNGVRLSAIAVSGLSLVRTITLEDGYAFSVEDRFSHGGEAPVTQDVLRIRMGPMENMEASGAGAGAMAYLGADALKTEDRRVLHAGKQLPGLFGVRGGCSRADLRGTPLTANRRLEGPFDWVAVKNKFFTQILAPVEPAGIPAVDIRADRADTDGAFRLETVSAVLPLRALTLEPGESQVRHYRYYAGPKKYARLKAEGGRRTEIMEFGRFFKPVCKVLLPLLNGIEFLVPGGYGVAIIILTILVKGVFWPVTHKGTESMKRMQALQPEIKKLREKYKNDPKKLQEKQMQLYREHKVNPMAGCLPMLIQIPVFIGLFTVLRSAVELRFTRFLWIRDLSEPEGLLAGVLPFPSGGLNVLPLLMTATMVLQQKLTPSAGDPQQQKMMAFMPVMMLFIFYNMPSALVLYWTVSQLLSILQLVMQQRRDRSRVAVVPA